MPPKKSESATGKRKTVRTTIEFKKELIRKYESGVRVSALATEFKMAKSTISTIIKQKEAIKASDVAVGVKAVTKQRPKILEEVEKLALIFVKEKQLAGDSVSEEVICQKALAIFEDLKKSNPDSVEKDFIFKASRGWFDNFKKRSGIHSVVRHGEASSSDVKAAEAFKRELSQYIKEKNYLPQQVFNCDETGLFWKKMPRRTYITKEEKSLPGHKPMKDRFTLLLCCNASGDCKIKPLMVYHSENPRAFKAHNIQKANLPVMWRSNSKAWLTRLFFTEWVCEALATGAEKYLEENGLPKRCLLLMDNAPAHPPDLADELTGKYDFIEIKFLPPNTTPLIQPMDQQVISNFKKLYTKSLFRRCFEVTNDTELTLRDFWKNHFNIVHCINIVDKAWAEVSYSTMNSAWRKLLPEFVTERDFAGFDPGEGTSSTGTATATVTATAAAALSDDDDEDDTLVNDIVSLGHTLGLEVDNDDIQELIDEHTSQLTTEELLHLQNEQKKNLEEEHSEEEGAGREAAPTAELKEACSMWSKLQTFVTKYHPDNATTSRMNDMYNDNVMWHFRKILNSRKKQVSIERYFKPSKRPADDPDPDDPDVVVPPKRAREKTPELPLVLLEGDSPSKQ